MASLSVSVCEWLSRELCGVLWIDSEIKRTKHKVYLYISVLVYVFTKLYFIHDEIFRNDLNTV